MSRRKAYWPTIIAAAALFGAIAVGANAAGAFVEPNVQVLQEFDGTAGPGTDFGWAVSELDDVDGDHVEDAIVGEPFTDGGSTYVYSGRTGSLLYRFDGTSGDYNGFSMADAGDANGDRVHDILVGAPGNGAGHVDLYSGKTGELLHRFIGASAGDAFGWSVSSAGDVDRDHQADVLIGASQGFSGAGSGYASIYSGRTYELIRTLNGDRVGDQFGSGAASSRDVNRDHVPDQIVGARDAGNGARGQVYVYSGRPASGCSRSTLPLTATRSARSSSPASATSIATARPTSTQPTTTTRPTEVIRPTSRHPAERPSTPDATGTSCSRGLAPMRMQASARAAEQATSTTTATRI